MLVARLVAVPVFAVISLIDSCVEGGEPFNDVNNATLNVTVGGTGNGTVTATSSNSEYSAIFAAIHCRNGSGTCTASTDLDVHDVTTITLTAAPDPDSKFV